MAISEESLPAGKEDHHYPLGGPRFNLVAATLGALLVGGIYLLGWATNHTTVENPIISVWAAGMYAGYVLIAALLIRASLVNHAAGYPWRRSLPPVMGSPLSA